MIFKSKKSLLPSASYQSEIEPNSFRSGAPDCAGSSRYPIPPSWLTGGSPISYPRHLRRLVTGISVYLEPHIAKRTLYTVLYIAQNYMNFLW